MGKPDFLKQFAKLKAIVLNTVGRSEFEKGEDGKAILTAADKEKLSATFTPAFMEQFEKGLDTEAALSDQQATAEAAMEQLRKDNGTALAEMTEKVNAAVARAEKAEKAQATLQQAVEVLSGELDGGAAEVIKGTGAGQGAGAGVKELDSEAKHGPWYGIKPDMKHFHNRMGMGMKSGDTSLAMSASNGSFSNSGVPGMTGNTVNVDEMYSEFGTYLSQANIRLDILQKLSQKTESQQYMTTKMAITEWRAATALITSVVQQFVAKWTPLGSSKFTPLTIKNRHHKVNLPITPDDINDSWLSYLYDEQVTPEQMPVTRFIIERLLRPAIDRDIEMLMIATGVYEELGEVTEGNAGQATGKNMDGYVTILKKEKATGTSDINFYDPSLVAGLESFTEITFDNVVDVIEGYVDYVSKTAPLYAKAGMNIFIDPDVYRMFKKKYRELYPTTKNEDKNNDKPDFSNLVFVPLNAMTDTGTFFSTPKENFIRLIHKNAAGGETKLWMQTENYTVKVFAEFWLGVGFALAELVFAFVPESAESGSGA